MSTARDRPCSSERCSSRSRTPPTRARRPARLLSPAATTPVPVVRTGERTLVLVRHGAYDTADPRDEATGKGLVPLDVAQARLAGDRLRALPYRVDGLPMSARSRARSRRPGVIAARRWRGRR